jgi:hypothetical protein
VRPASQSPSPARRRSFALFAGLLITLGAVTACSDDGPPTPAISGESPGDVTVPTLPPTTTTATDDDPASDTTVPADDDGSAEDDGGSDTGVDATESSAPTTTEA